jgi:hypothetical protein
MVAAWVGEGAQSLILEGPLLLAELGAITAGAMSFFSPNAETRLNGLESPSGANFVSMHGR